MRPDPVRRAACRVEWRSSMSSADDPPGDARQPATEPRSSKRFGGAIDAIGRQPAGGIEAVKGRIRRFAGRGVLAGGLAEISRGSFHVENVVDDLKREADVD